MEKKYQNKRDIEKYLRSVFDFKKATKADKEKWPYKSKLYTSIKNLYGKKLYFNGKFVGIVKTHKYSLKSAQRIYLITDKKENFTLTNSSIELFNSFYKRNEIISLHPTRSGKKFWSCGYLVDEKDYKSLYYSTGEFREKYEKSLNENFGTVGLTSPIQIESIKNKISNTIKENYGVSWFLSRGSHYSAVTTSMLENHGVENLFYSEEWQRKNLANGGFSKLEEKFFKELISEINFVSPNYCSSENGQFVLREKISKKSYFLDFYDNKLNIVIEFYGDFWHCNPNNYEKNYFHPIKKIKAEEIWEEDRKRKQDIINSLPGVKFFEIWESDWKNNKNVVKRFLKNQIFNK